MHFIIGMHKSGTTVCARALHESGVLMGRFESGLDYKACKYEDTSFREVNNCLLKSHKKQSLDTIGPLKITERTSEKASEFITYASDHGITGVKDPRGTLTYEFWAKRLQVDSILFCFRDYESIYRHYSKRPLAWKILYGWQWEKRLLAAWQIYNCKALSILRNARRPYSIIDFNEHIHPVVLSMKMSELYGRPIKDVVARKGANQGRGFAEGSNLSFLKLSKKERKSAAEITKEVMRLRGC